MYKLHSERWTEDLFGEGPQLGHDHVMISKEWMEKLPPRFPQEVALLSTIWDADEITEASRLACMVVLEKEIDGMTVYLPDRVPDGASRHDPRGWPPQFSSCRIEEVTVNALL